MVLLPKSILIFASGRGTDFQAILDHCRLGILKDVEISGLVCNHPNAPVVQRANGAGIRVYEIEGVVGKQFASKEEKDRARTLFEQNCLDLIQKQSIDYIILAGFDQIVSKLLVEAYKMRIVNIHPAYDVLRFGGRNMLGRKIHEKVIQSGVKYSGCTVHFVTADIDLGPTILKKKVSIVEGETPDSLEQKILRVEHLAYPQAIQLLVDNRVLVDPSVQRCYIDLYSEQWDIEWEKRQMKYHGIE